MRRMVVLFAMACLLALPAMASADNTDGKAHMSKKVTDKANQGGQEKVDVIVTYHQRSGPAEHARVKNLGGTVKRQFRNFPMKVIRIPAHALEAMANSHGVKFVALDSELEAFSPSAMATSRLPEAGSSQFVTAQADVGVAVLDSGVGDHWDIDVQSRVDCLGSSPGGRLPRRVRQRQLFQRRRLPGLDGILGRDERRRLTLLRPRADRFRATLAGQPGRRQLREHQPYC